MKNMKGADAFERSLKESLETYEVPYNSADWSQLERKLDSGRTSTWQASAGLYMLLAGGTMALMTTAFVMFTNDPKGNGTADHVVMLSDREEQHDSGMDAEAGLTDPFTSRESAATVLAPQEVIPETTAATPAEDATTPKATRIASASTNTRKDPATAVVPAIEPVESVTGTEKPAALAIKASVAEGCPGTTVEFNVDNMPEDGIHLWNFGDGSFSNKPSPTHTFSKSGTFEVMLSHSSMAGGNIRNKPAADRIVIHEAPEAAFNYLKQEYDNTVPSIHFENRSIGGSRYLWDFGDGTNSTTPHPDHVFKKQGTYQVSLTTTNAKGCVDRTERTIVIDRDYDLLAPKTFSPDGNGVEDYFIPEALKTLGARFHMSIFSPDTGDLIYETSDPQRAWNGRIGNKGELCTPGDYVWLVEMKDGDKLGGTYTGNVTLVR